MSSSKREREYERRRYEKWQQRQAEHKARRRRLQVIVGSLLGVLLLAVGVAVAVAVTNDQPSADSSPTGSPSPAASPSKRTLPDASLAGARTWTGKLTLSSGPLAIELDGAAAPQAVANFVTLAKDGYFNGTVCHRLALGIHVLQCGDPTATGDAGSGGAGGPGYAWGPIENAPADGVYKAGTIAMARQPNNGSSMGSQFFLVYQDSTIPSDSAGGYTIFGHITSGLGVV